MSLKKHLSLGPLTLIKKRAYGWGILALLFQFTLPLLLMMTLYWPTYWTAMQEAWLAFRTGELNMSHGYVFFVSPYYCMATAPIFWMIAALLTRFIWGFIGYRYYGHYEQQLQQQGPYLKHDDYLSKNLAALGFYAAFVGLLLAGVPYEHAFHSEHVDQPYAYADAIQQLNSQILVSLQRLGITLLYLLVRLFFNKAVRKSAV